MLIRKGGRGCVSPSTPSGGDSWAVPAGVGSGRRLAGYLMQAVRATGPSAPGVWTQADTRTHEDAVDSMFP